MLSEYFIRVLENTRGHEIQSGWNINVPLIYNTLMRLICLKTLHIVFVQSEFQEVFLVNIIMEVYFWINIAYLCY